MHLADEVSFEIYSGKIGEIKLPKNNSKIFDGRFFFRKFQKIKIGIGLMTLIGESRDEDYKKASEIFFGGNQNVKTFKY